MFALCAGLFMNAWWIESAVPPMPTFSPTAYQLVTSFARFGLW